MLIYLIALAIVFVLAYYAQTKQRVLEDGVIKKTNKNGKWAIAGVCAILIFIGGFRADTVGSDYGVYKGLFTMWYDSPILKAFLTDEGLFWGITSIIGKLTKNVTVMFVLSQAVIILCIVPTLTKYTHNLSLTIFLYLAGFDYFSSFNCLRQWVAAAILFASLPMLKERKIFRYCLMCCFAYFFHNTAILMIPIGLFVLTKPNSKWNMLAVAAVGVVFFLFPSLFERLLSGFIDEKYDQFVGMEGDDGINIMRVLVAAVPPVLTRIFYDKLYEGDEDKRFFDLLINFSTVNFVFCMVGTRGTFLYRMTMYTSPFNCLLIPYLLRAFKKESRFTAKVLMMALFGAYLIMLLPVDANVVPYRTIFGWPV